MPKAKSQNTHFKDLPEMPRWKFETELEMRKISDKAKAGDDEAVEHLAEIARAALRQLEILATLKRNKAACLAWITALNTSIRWLENMEPIMPEMFRPLAEKMDRWPGYFTVNKDLQERNQLVIQKISLAAKFDLNCEGKQASRKTPEVNAAMNFYSILCDLKEKVEGNIIYQKPSWVEARLLAKKLQPLTRSNYRDWWQAAQPLFIDEYGNDFENHADWNHIRSKGDVLSTSRKKNSRGLIRREIKQKICQAFKSIAPR